MGRMLISFNYGTPGVNALGWIDLSILTKITNSLPGITTINGVVNNNGLSIALVHIGNDNFVDGTEIVPKFKRVAVPTGIGSMLISTGGIAYVDIFDGIDIVPPGFLATAQTPTGSSQQSTGGTTANTPNGVPAGVIGTNVGTPNYYPSTYTLPTYKVIPQYHTETNPYKNISPNCTCGAESVGSTSHAGYCDTNVLPSSP